MPKIYLMLVLVTFLLHTEIYAAEQNEIPSFEENFKEAGFTSVEEAVAEFENNFNCKVELPKMVPPISFTHQFGRFFEDKRFKLNDNLGIMFVNKDHRKIIFKIDIRPANNKITFDGKEYVLQYGGKGIYLESDHFNFYVFEKNKLQYLMGIHHEMADVVTPNVLVQIARLCEGN